MKILLVGGHQKTNFLTKSLKAKRHTIIIINEDYEWCKMLSNVHDVVCVHGDGTKPFILEDAGVATMDTVIALSNKDSTNLIVCEIAKKKFHVQHTIAIVNDPKNVELFRKLGVNKCISATKMISEIVESEAVFENIQEYLPLENGKLVCLEMTLTVKSRALKKELMDIGLPGGCIIGCVIREEKTIVPKGNTILQAGDKIIMLSSPDVIDRASALLSGR